jgi:hypothetical protein
MNAVARLPEIPNDPCAAASVLDLFHPSGAAAILTTIGSAPPPYLVGERRSIGDVGADAVLLAPSEEECRADGWLAGAAATIARTLSANGIVYAVIPRRWRRTVANLLAAHGLFVAARYIHLRQGARTHYVIPCDPAIVRRLLTTLAARRRFVVLAGAAWAIPGAAFIARAAWGSTGMLLRRPGARAALAWTPAVQAGASCAGWTVIRHRSVGARTHAVISSFGIGGDLAAVIKAPLSESAIDASRREALSLSRLAVSASRAGAVVPTANYAHEARPALHLEPLRGTPVAHLLRSDPARLETTVCRIGEWLRLWHELTARPGRATSARLTSEVLAPASRLADRLPGGPAYVRWLEARCALVQDAHLPFVASHNDLTVSNLLITEHGKMGVLDWEGARYDGLPLVDLFYSAASACEASGSRATRAAAFIDAYNRSTSIGAVVAAIAATTASSLRLSVPMADLLRHAAAIQHAADECAREGTDGGPFLQLLRWLAHAEMYG